MIWWTIFILFSQALADRELYIKQCLDGANPYNSFADPEKLLKKVDQCLASAYISFPDEDRASFKEQIQKCIHNIRETDRSKPEFRLLERQVAQLTSNSGDSIVETQHVMSQLAVCTENLKIIANADVYEEARFEELTGQFEKLLQDANTCIEGGVAQIQDQIKVVDERLVNYEQKYEQWKTITKNRQEATENCHKELDDMIKQIHRHILSELHS